MNDIDFDFNTILSLSFSPLNETWCLRIPIMEDGIQEGKEILQLELESTDSQVFILCQKTTVNILEVCYNGELRLSDGFDENQGRVEICFDGVWGTVCHNSWDNVDAHVVCHQLGLNSGSMLAL